jgi:hypothetical protein
MRVGLPVRNDSGSIATNYVHHSGASAAEFHRLPDAPKARERILSSLAKASFTDSVAEAEVEEPRHRLAVELRHHHARG